MESAATTCLRALSALEPTTPRAGPVAALARGADLGVAMTEPAAFEPARLLGRPGGIHDESDANEADTGADHVKAVRLEAVQGHPPHQ